MDGFNKDQGLMLIRFQGVLFMDNWTSGTKSTLVLQGSYGFQRIRILVFGLGLLDDFSGFLDHCLLTVQRLEMYSKCYTIFDKRVYFVD